MLTILSSKKTRAKVIATVSDEELPSKLEAVLYLPHIPVSIKYRPYLDKVGAVTLLEWFLDNFASANQRVSLSILFHLEDATSELNDVLIKYNVTSISTPHQTQTKAFQQAARQARKPYIAFFTIEMGLSPMDLLTNAFLHHMKHRNKFTFIEGLPQDCSPEIYDSDFLIMICDQRLPHIPQTPRSFIEYSLVGLTDGAPALPRNKASRYFATALRKFIGASLVSIPFNASGVYSGDSSDLPESVRMETQFQLEITRSVINSRPQSDPLQSPLQALHLWKKHLLQKQVEIRKSLVDSANASTNWVGIKQRKRRRILFVSNSSGYSGAEESLCQLVGRLDPGLYESFALIGVSGFFTERLQKFGAQIITQERDFSTTTVDNFLFAMSTLKKAQPDVIHINSISGMPIVLAAKLLRVPIVYHLRKSQLEALGDVLNNSDVVIAVSEFVKQEASKKDLHKEKIRVIFDGVDSQHFSRDPFDKTSLRKEYGLPLNARIVLNIARFAPNKRHDLLIAASAIVARNIPDFHLVLVGEAYDKQCHRSVVEQISQLGLSRQVTFIDFQRDIRRIEAAADMLVLCSDREPLGTCLMEAMAMELPVVVTDSGGSHELFEHERTGLIVPGGGVNELADAITRVLIDNELAERLRCAAREYAQTELSIDLHAKRVSQIYEEVIASTTTNIVFPPR